MRACGGVWIAHGSGSADRETVDRNDRVAVPPERSRLFAAPRLAQRGGAGRLLLRLRQRRLVAALSHRLRAADLPRERLGALRRRQSPLRRRRRAGGAARGPDRAGAGLSFRAAAAHDPRTAAARHRHHVLAHSLAKRRDLQHLSVARGDHRRVARQLDPRLSHALSLQQFPGRRRPLHGEPHRPRAQFGDAGRPRDAGARLSDLDRMAAGGAGARTRRSPSAAASWSSDSG